MNYRIIVLSMFIIPLAIWVHCYMYGHSEEFLFAVQQSGTLEYIIGMGIGLIAFFTLPLIFIMIAKRDKTNSKTRKDKKCQF